MYTLSLKKIYSGKVRDLYEINKHNMLMVATDRLSAFDVILNQQIAHKGELLTEISLFWFDKLKDICPNHLLNTDTKQSSLDANQDNLKKLLNAEDYNKVKNRALVVKRLKLIPIEAIVRGYIIGNAWKEYSRYKTISSKKIDSHLVLADKLPEILFTPTTKASVGAHDEAIDDEHFQQIAGIYSEKIKQYSIQLYTRAAQYAQTKGIIIADTKFEFGVNENGDVVLMDEVLTPDSSRFWDLAEYKAGTNPASFDKQFVRDWLNHSSWNKMPPAPDIPETILQRTAAKYLEVRNRLCGNY